MASTKLCVYLVSEIAPRLLGHLRSYLSRAVSDPRTRNVPGRDGQLE